jgi:hypothetical protein
MVPEPLSYIGAGFARLGEWQLPGHQSEVGNPCSCGRKGLTLDYQVFRKKRRHHFTRTDWGTLGTVHILPPLPISSIAMGCSPWLRSKSLSRRWSRMPLAEMIQALEEMQVLAEKLSQSSEELLAHFWKSSTITRG